MLSEPQWTLQINFSARRMNLTMTVPSPMSSARLRGPEESSRFKPFARDHSVAG